MRMKAWVKTLSVLLAALFVIQILPLSVMAQELNRPEDTKTVAENGESILLGEETGERTANTKQFRRADGTKTRIYSTNALHYKKDGKWVEIDNTLVRDKNGQGQGVLRNKANAFELTLPQSMEAGKAVRLELDGAALSFAPQKNVVQKAARGQFGQSGKASREQTGAQKASNLAKTASRVTYENVRGDTDLEYTVLSAGIKENIILRRAPKEKAVYSFAVTVDKLTPRLQKDNSILFENEEHQTVFRIPAPVMYDANLHSSKDIEVEFKANPQGGYILSYAPSMEWLTAKQRSYPVAVDPVVHVGGGENQILRDTTIIGQGSANDTGSDAVFCTVSTRKGSDRDESSALYDFRYAMPVSVTPQSVVKATLQLYMGSLYTTGNCNVTAHRITSDWDAAKVTYNTRPTVESKAQDYVSAKSDDLHWETLDLTELCNGWNTGKYPNYGIQLNTADDNAAIIYSNEMGAQYAPVLEITYRDTLGVNSEDSYHTMSAEDAGTVYWNDLTNAFAITREELGLSGNIMPVSIKRTFNSADPVLRNPYGQGWTVNYAQKLYYDGSMFKYTDETGAVHYFMKNQEPSEDGREQWGEETASGMGLGGGTVLTMDKGNKDYKKYTGLSIAKADGTTLRFDAGGRLSTITDASKNANQIKITYNESTRGIDMITDGVGRRFKFLYDTTAGKLPVLTAIEARDSSGAPITFVTDDGQTVPIRVDYTYGERSLLDARMVKVAYPGGKTMEYTCGTSLFTLKDSSNGTVEITHSNGRASRLVKKVYDKETAASLLHSSLVMQSDGRTQKEFTDQDGNTELIQYDATGRVLSRRQKCGEAVFSHYGADGQATVSPGTATNMNLLKNPDFSDGLNGWSQPTLFSVAVASGEVYHSEPKSCQVGYMYANPFWMEQTVENMFPGEYTLSAYFRIEENGAREKGAGLRLMALDQNGQVLETKISPYLNSTAGQWQQQTVRMSAPAGTAKIVAGFGSEKIVGQIYVDDVQLVCSGVEPEVTEEAAARYNYIKNGDFTKRNALLGSATDWSYNLSHGKTAAIASDDTRDPGLDSNVYQLTGAPGKTAQTSQTVQINGKKGENFTLAGWGQSSAAVPNTIDESRFFGIRVEEKKSDGTYAQLETLHFEYGTSGWQYYGVPISLDHDVSQVRVTLCYTNQMGNAQFDGIQLYKEDWTSTGGDIELGGEEEKTCPCGKCAEPDCACKCSSEAVCNCPQCKRYTQVTSDNNGNITQNKATDGQNSVIMRNTFTSNGNYLKTTSNGAEGTVTYGYNEKNGLMQSADDMAYGYDQWQNISKVAQRVSGLTNGSAITNTYQYDTNGLQTIEHNGFEYRVKENAFGNLTGLSIGAQNFLRNEYSKDNRQQLQSTSFGNGQKLCYRYNEKGDVIGASQDGGVSWRFTYQYAGGQLKSVTDHVRNTKLVYGNYEVGEVDLSTGKTIYSIKTESSHTMQTVAGGLFTRETKSSDRDIKTGSTTKSSLLTIGEETNMLKGNTLTFSSKTDYFGRQAQKTIAQIHKTGATYNLFARTSNLTYETYANNETGGRIKTYQDILKHGSTSVLEATYGYTYDAKGNITGITKNGTAQSSYTYDEAGQLRTETNNGIKTTYQYDVGGNLRSKIKGNTVINYEYGDENWKDKLTSYNGKPITYDAIGNPLTYDGWTYTWQAGRQLKKMVKGTTAIEYQYNEEGLRTQKKVSQNGAVTTYDYVWNDGKLISQTAAKGAEKTSMYFFYDEEGKAAGFVYNNSDTYYYQTNAQGDICAVVKEDGTIAATYTYDAWGNLLSSSGKMAQVNPLTYRGYQYDHETGYYYLQSRYYNPEWNRFINADIIINSQFVIGNNLFLYCLNSPINYYDTSGMNASRDRYVTNILIITILYDKFLPATVILTMLAYYTTTFQMLPPIKKHFTFDELDPDYYYFYSRHEKTGFGVYAFDGEILYGYENQNNMKYIDDFIKAMHDINTCLIGIGIGMASVVLGTIAAVITAPTGWGIILGGGTAVVGLLGSAAETIKLVGLFQDAKRAFGRMVRYGGLMSI